MNVAKSRRCWNPLKASAACPRLKPPFPAVVGAFQSPTILNNCETFASVPVIFRKGADRGLLSLGTPKNGGTRLTVRFRPCQQAWCL